MRVDVAALRRDFPIFEAQPAPFHYLDSAATAQICRPALQALCHFEGEARANVKRGVYRLAEAATRAFEEARRQVARLLGGVDPAEVVFTAGTTLALNLAAHGLSPRLGPGRRVLVSVLEHHSNLVPWQLACARTGAELVAVPATADGRLDHEALERLLDSRVAVVALTHASNVTGAVSDVARVARAVRAVGAVLVVDGAQRIPHGPLDVRRLGCDLYAFSGHKAYGATGAGVLWGRRELLESFPPFLGGGEMITRVTLAHSSYREPPHRFEAGTPPIGPVLALGAAARWMMAQDWQALRAHEEALTRRLLEGLAAMRDVRILGPTDVGERIGVVTFTLGSHHPHDICQLLDEHGVCTRGGHHCAQPLMDHFGIEASVRASLAPYNDEADVDALLEGLETVRRILG